MVIDTEQLKKLISSCMHSETEFTNNICGEPKIISEATYYKSGDKKGQEKTPAVYDDANYENCKEGVIKARNKGIEKGIADSIKKCIAEALNPKGDLKIVNPETIYQESSGKTYVEKKDAYEFGDNPPIKESESVEKSKPEKESDIVERLKGTLKAQSEERDKLVEENKEVKEKLGNLTKMIEDLTKK